MPVGFLACAKAGVPYVPIDINMPENRIKDIIDSVEPQMVLTTENRPQYKEYVFLDITAESLYEHGISVEEKDWVKANNVFYIIFTSGSTRSAEGSADHIRRIKLFYGMGDFTRGRDKEKQ